MKLSIFSSLRTLLALLVLVGYVGAITGCNDETSTESHDDEHEHGDDEDHDEHDEDDPHAGHDHPAHGPNGGHLVNLSDGAHAEWTHFDLENRLSVIVENPDEVTKVEMLANDKAYEFEKTEVDGKTIFTIQDEVLLTAVKMGEAVKTELKITTEAGSVTGPVKHHAH